MRKTIIIIIMNLVKAGSDELDYFKESAELYFGRKLMRPEDQIKNTNILFVNEHLFIDDKKYLEEIKPDGCSLAYIFSDDNQDASIFNPWIDLCIDETDLVNEP